VIIFVATKGAGRGQRPEAHNLEPSGDVKLAHEGGTLFESVSCSVGHWQPPGRDRAEAGDGENAQIPFDPVYGPRAGRIADVRTSTAECCPSISICRPLYPNKSFSPGAKLNSREAEACLCPKKVM
jgi:hypothetical protein